MIISIILTLIFDHDTIYESIFRGIWYLTCIFWCALDGTKKVVAIKDKSVYFNYFLIIGLISFLVLTR